MSLSEGSVGDVEVEQGSQVSREGGLDIQVAEVLHGGVKRVRRAQAPRFSCKRRVGYTHLLE